MRRLLLMSVVFGPVILPIWLSHRPNPRRALSLLVVALAIFFVFWALVCSRVFFLFSGE
jgi:hypothetical protein